MGQLFHPPEQREVLEPERIMDTELLGDRVLDVSCGVHFSMILTETKGKQLLWMCGQYVARFINDVGEVRQAENLDPAPSAIP